MAEYQYDVAVLGGGVIGLCAAYYIRKTGQTVAVVDRGSFSDGASHVNVGLIVPSHFEPLAAPGVIAQGLKWLANPESPFYIKPRVDLELTRWLLGFQSNCTQENVDRCAPLLRDLALESLRLHVELAALPGFEQIGFAHNGLLVLHTSDKSRMANLNLADAAETVGLEVERLDHASTLDLEPEIRTPMSGSILFRQDASFDPERFMAALVGELRREGVDLLEHTDVSGMTRSKSSVSALETDGAPIHARQFVLAGGAWTAGLGKMLDVRIPIQPAKGYSITVDNPENALKIPVMISERKIIITPMPGRIRFGGTMTFEGFDTSVDEIRTRPLKRTVELYCPELEATGRPVPSARSGFRPCTTDGMPVVGRPRNWDNVVVAAGHGTLGMTNGPITGKLVADLLSETPSSIDITPLSPNRF